MPPHHTVIVKFCLTITLGLAAPLSIASACDSITGCKSCWGGESCDDSVDLGCDGWYPGGDESDCDGCLTCDRPSRDRCGCSEQTYQSCLAKFLDPSRDRTFPLFNKKVQELGYQLPLPFGAGVNAAYIDQSMSIQSISLSVAGGPSNRLDRIPPFTINSYDTNVSSRFDFWILPFLNIYALAGRTTGSASGQVVVTGVPGLLPDTVIPINVDYDGPTYGGGVTSAIGYKCFFTAVDWNYTATDLEGFDNAIAARTVATRMGIQNEHGALWAGGFYLNFDKNLSATVDAGGTPVRFEIDLDADTNWNFIYGGRWVPCPNIEFVIEHGFGRRDQFVGVGTLRF